MLVRVRAKFYFLYRDVLLMLLGLMKLLIHLVKVLAVIHDPANRRVRSRRYLYQVQAPLFGNPQRLLRWHDSELLVLGANDPYFASPDSLVNPYVFVDGLASSNISNGTNLKDNIKPRSLCPGVFVSLCHKWSQTCQSLSMSFYNRIAQYHSESRPSFVLF